MLLAPRTALRPTPPRAPILPAPTRVCTPHRLATPRACTPRCPAPYVSLHPTPFARRGTRTRHLPGRPEEAGAAGGGEGK